ncbi:hypothetical protein SAMN04488518_1214 [Pseudovibrio ascidiaceicola]|uniref:Uncharacterized protein n=1 Tax=Pseudovibrio ascidiaceicola TaxID=285279 RepID=A0A1I4FNH1_9HYPH|nr:hypothetical protein [Pseudovibrio ascidiaceicola]SFL19462.1 hypothetical protein SAMN04488518_1214 [Pseudovibrio ascidiaceicola]
MWLSSIKKKRIASFAAVTTFNRQGYEKYGKNFLRSFIKYWPQEVKLFVYAEDAKVEFDAPNIVVFSQRKVLNDLVSFKEDYSRNKFANGINPVAPDMEKSFRWDAVRFSNKVFAIHDAIERSIDIYDHLIWLDADIVTHDAIPLTFLEKLSPLKRELAAYLNRKGCPECGWVDFNLRHPQIKNFADSFKKIYSDGLFLRFKESHDSYVFWELVKQFERQKRVRFKHLGSRWASGHVFVNSELGRYMDHLKGTRKDVGHSKSSDLYRKRSEVWWQIAS